MHDTDLIHERFLARVKENPDAVALVDGDRSTSYAELDRLSATAEKTLRALGVGPGRVVALLLPPSTELVIAVLAVLRCGAAYAALDVAWPPERLRQIAELLDGQLAIANDPIAAFSGRLVTIAEDGALDADVDASPPAIAPQDGRGAMIFFTSGSTGAPKPVLSPHSGTTRLFDPCTFGRFDETTVMAQVSALPWDAFAWELWGPLVNGGTCVLLRERPLTPAALRELVHRHGVNTLLLSTALFHLIVEEDVRAFAGLRVVYTGGEKLSGKHAGEFLAALPDLPLVNSYGPVESTVISSTHRVRPCDVDGDVPIGVTVARTRNVIMLDGRQCADGETGELCIAGDGLAIGYLGDDELTATKFVVLPVDGQPTRLYRTGDLASVGPDGILRFHGRMDRQVKVRGHRIEPAGVEQVAEGVAGVRRAAVVPVRDDNGNVTALALFHISEDEEALRAALRAALPAYSVPDHVIAVTEFPLSSNGKVDKSALLRAHEARLSRATLVVAAGGTVDEIVAAEAGSLLGQASIDPSASLFALGATSLDAVRLCARLSTRLDRYIPVSALLRAPTVRDLAQWLAGRSAPRASGTSGSGTPLTASQHSFLLSHLISGDDTANFCVQNWVLDGTPQVDALRAAVQDVHRRHGYLSARYTSGERTLLVASDTPAEFVEITGGQADLDAALYTPFDLAKGLVWRAVLAQENETSRFGIAVHHIAFDGWSQHLLTADLGLAYAARCANSEPGFPQPVPGPTATFDMLTGLAEAADLDAQRSYWANALRGLPAMNWPAPGRAGELPRVVEHPVALAGIDESARAKETSRLAVLLAAVSEAVTACTGRSDFGVGVPVNRRGTEELQRPIGCLIDTVCVRVGADPKLAVRDALANSDVSFAEVVRLSKPARSARHPLYQVIVAVQDSPAPALRLSGCDTRIGRQHEIPWTRTEFVVELFVTDGARLRFTHDPAVLGDDLVTELIHQVRERLDAHRWE